MRARPPASYAAGAPHHATLDVVHAQAAQTKQFPHNDVGKPFRQTMLIRQANLWPRMPGSSDTYVHARVAAELLPLREGPAIT